MKKNMRISNMGMIQDGDGALTTAKCFPARWNTASKSCEFCKSAAALLFCRSDSTFTCLSCDAKMHAPLKHERVWLCDVCEQAPAAVTCKADSAALCYTCDRDIHSANPLARRHERAPVVPFYGTAESIATKSTAAAAFPVALQSDNDRKLVDCITNDNYISDPWISKLPADLKSLELLFSDSDRFLDFDSYQIPSQLYSDSVVPIQTTTAPPPAAGQLSHEHSPENRFEIDFTRSNINSYSNSVSSSSIEVGVVPDGSTISEASYHFSKTFNSSTDLIGNQGNLQVTAMDRKARVLRYMEKRKNRKFQKTIRYASRKAYAETRPRMKGRFVKRTDSDLAFAGIFSSGEANFVADARYGVVPSFR